MRVSVDLENSLILIQGSIPGATGSRVILRPSRGEKIEFPTEETHPEEWLWEDMASEYSSCLLYTSDAADE